MILIVAMDNYIVLTGNFLAKSEIVYTTIFCEDCIHPNLENSRTYPISGNLTKYDAHVLSSKGTGIYQ